MTKSQTLHRIKPHTKNAYTPRTMTTTINSCKTCKSLPIIIVLLIVILIFLSQQTRLKHFRFFSSKQEYSHKKSLQTQKKTQTQKIYYTVFAGILTTLFLWFMLKGQGQPRLGSCKPNSYVSSPIERTWYEHVESLQNDRDAFCAFDDRLSAHDNEEKYSYMTCGHDTRVEIEPLVSVLRDPRFPCKDDSAKMLATKSWIHLKIPPRDPKGSSYLFDLGASRYRYGIGGSSLDWLVETFDSKRVRGVGVRVCVSMYHLQYSNHHSFVS